MRPMREEVSCQLCGQSEPDLLFVGRDLELGGDEPWPVVRCRACGFTYTSPRPGPDAIGAYYPAEYGQFTAHRALPARLARRLEIDGRAAEIRALVPHARTALDVGCGIGELAAGLARQGLAVRGVDPSAHAAEVARTEFGLDVKSGPLAGAGFASGSFDLITMIHVLEHVPDPIAELEAVGRLLAPGGRLIVELPNCDSFEARLFGRYWFGWHLPRHFSHFTAATLTRALDRAGYAVERLHYFAHPTLFVGSLTTAIAHTLAPGRKPGRWVAALRPLLKLAAAPFTFALTRVFGRPSGVMDVVARRR